MSTDRKTTAKNLAYLRDTWGEPSIEAVIARLAANATMALRDTKVMNFPSLKYRRKRLGESITPLQVVICERRHDMLLELRNKWNLANKGVTVLRILDEAQNVTPCGACVADTLRATVGDQRTHAVTANMPPRSEAIWKTQVASRGQRYQGATLELLIAAAWVSEFRPPCNHTYTQARLPV